MKKIAGIDVGCGDVKVYMERNGTEGREFKFPTAICHAKGLLEEAGREEIEFNGKKYVVGEDAVLNAFSTRSLDFLLQYAPLLCYKALKELGDVTHIAAGLPLAYYTKENKAELIKKLSTFQIGQKIFTQTVDVFPQGAAVLVDYRYAEKCREKEETILDGLILDIGFFTIDVLPFEKGVAVRDGSGMIEGGGVAKMLEELGDNIFKDLKVQLNELELKTILATGELSVFGKPIDKSVAVREIIERYVEELLHAIHGRWEKRLQRAQKLVIAGGGAHYLKDHIPTKYKELLYIPEKPEFANARGFLKAMRLKLSEAEEE